MTISVSDTTPVTDLGAVATGPRTLYWNPAANANWGDIGSWSLTDGGSTAGVAPPRSIDNVYFSNTNSYTCTISATSYCANLDFTYGTGFTGTFIISNTMYVSGSLTMSSTMTSTWNTYVYLNATSGSYNITANGKSLNYIDFQNAGATYTMQDSWTCSYFYCFSNFVANGKTVTVTGIINASSTTFYNLILSGSSTLQLYTNVSVSNNLTITGTNNTTSRLLVLSSTVGTPRTITCNGAITASNCDFQDITGAGTASWDLHAITGLSGDCGGNSGITFTAPADQHWIGAIANGGTGTWATAANWTSRVPLPQDNVYMNFAFGTSCTVSANMLRLGKTIDWTGATWTTALTWSLATTNSLYGSMTLISGLTVSGTSGLTFAGRGSYTFDSKNISFLCAINTSNPTGTLQLLNNLTTGANFNLGINYGTFDANGYNVNTKFVSGGSGSASILMGSGTWILTGNNAGGSWWTYTGGITAQGSTIEITDTSNTAGTFAGNNKTFNNIYFHRGTSTGSITITGSNTFNDFKDDGTGIHSIIFTAGTTTTVNTFTVSGSNPNQIVLNSSSTLTYNLVKTTDGVCNCDWLNIQHCIATPNKFFAGPNSTNNQNVYTVGSGWIFNALGLGNPTSYIGDTTVVSDVIIANVPFLPVSVSDISAITDNPFIFLPVLVLSMSDSSPPSDNPIIFIPKLTFSVSDTTAITDVPIVSLAAWTISIQDTSTISDSTTERELSYINLFDTTTITDAVVISISKLVFSVLDSTALSDSAQIGEISFVNKFDTSIITEGIQIEVVRLSNVADTTPITDSPQLQIISYPNKSDTSTIGEIIQVQIVSYPKVLDSSAVSDVPTIEIIKNVLVSDISAITDVPTIIIFDFPIVQDAISIADSVIIFIPVLTPLVSDATSASDSITLQNVKQGAVVSDITILSDALNISIPILTIITSDETDITDIFDVTLVNYIDTSDNTNISDLLNIQSSYLVNVSDGIVIGDQVSFEEMQYDIGISDTSIITELVYINVNVNVNLQDTALISELIDLEIIEFEQIGDTLIISESIKIEIISYISLSETINVSDIPYVGFPVDAGEFTIKLGWKFNNYIIEGDMQDITLKRDDLNKIYKIKV